MIEVGGEVRWKGETIEGRKWRICSEEPREERTQGQFQTIVVLDTMALATSGNYRKYWVNDKGQRVVHTIDPQTGNPVVSNLLSASIIAKNATMADALATASMVGGVEFKQFIEHLDGVEGYFILGNKLGGFDVVKTSGWEAYEL